MGKDVNIAAFIQVRMNSSRLPGKALLDIDGMTAIERVVESLKSSRLINDIVIVTTTDKSDDPIVHLAEDKGISFFRGDYDNIVKRFLGDEERYSTDIIVRVTGDCPVVSYEIADYLTKKHIEKKADFYLQ